MAIILYAESCEGCKGNLAVTRIKSYCNANGVKFEQRLTPLWRKFNEEATEISKKTGVKLPFFYATNAKTVMEATSFTNPDGLERLVELDKEATEV